MDDKRATSKIHSCHLQGELNEQNGYVQNIRLEISYSILHGKVPVVRTYAKLKRNVYMDTTATLMDVIAYGTTQPELWSHTKENHENNITRYLYVPQHEGTKINNRVVTIMIEFCGTSNQEVEYGYSLELAEINLRINTKTTAYLSVGSPSIYKFKNKGQIDRRMRVHIIRPDIETLFYQTKNRKGCSKELQYCSCTIVMIQSLDTPFHQSEEIYVGVSTLWQTMIGRSVIDVDVGGKEKYFKDGFYIVIVKTKTDVECALHDKKEGEYYNTRIVGQNDTTFRFNVEITEMDDINYVTTTMVVCIYLFIIVISAFVSIVCGVDISGNVMATKAQAPSSGDSKENRFSKLNRCRNKKDYTQLSDDSVDLDDKNSFVAKKNEQLASRLKMCQQSNSDDDSLASFTYKDSFQHGEEKLRSNKVFIVLLSGAFYIIPTVQLMFGAQRMSDLTGNHDFCYYNYLCRTPSVFFDDYSHVLSNAGYVFCGIYFIILVFNRRYRRRNAMVDLYWTKKHSKNQFDEKQLALAMKCFPHNKVEFLNKCGIPEQYGIDFAMGGALIFQGVLSACYHMCPTEKNFQFDTAFMYVMTILTFCKLYQFRHPDIASNAFGIFVFIVIMMSFEAIGYYSPSDAYLFVFVGAYLLSLFVLVGFLCFQPNYFVSIQETMCINKDNEKEKSKLVADTLRRSIAVPMDRKIFFILIIITNFILVGFFIYEICMENTLVVSDYILIIFGVNTSAYGKYYFAMKYYNWIKLGKSTESITLKSWIYIGIAIVFGIAGIIFFKNQEKATELSPSESRHLNGDCMFLFFDKHDIWHFISAFSVLFTFMALLTLEDNNTSTPWNEISVF